MDCFSPPPCAFLSRTATPRIYDLRAYRLRKQSYIALDIMSFISEYIHFMYYAFFWLEHERPQSHYRARNSSYLPRHGMQATLLSYRPSCSHILQPWYAMCRLTGIESHSIEHVYSRRHPLHYLFDFCTVASDCFESHAASFTWVFGQESHDMSCIDYSFTWCMRHMRQTLFECFTRWYDVSQPASGYFSHTVSDTIYIYLYFFSHCCTATVSDWHTVRLSLLHYTTIA
jgi:hypothetical protein